MDRELLAHPGHCLGSEDTYRAQFPAAPGPVHIPQDMVGLQQQSLPCSHHLGQTIMFPYRQAVLILARKAQARQRCMVQRSLTQAWAEAAPPQALQEGQVEDHQSGTSFTGSTAHCCQRKGKFVGGFHFPAR